MLTIDAQEIALSPHILSCIRPGQAVFIEQEHLPFAMLLPDGIPLAPRPIGLCKGEFVVPDNFNDPLEIWDSLEDASSYPLTSKISSFWITCLTLTI